MNLIRIIFSSLFYSTVLGISLVPSTATALPGDPIPDIDITIDQSPGGAVAGTGTTDASGTVVFANLAPGDYTITITDPSKLPGPAEVQVTLTQGERKHDTAKALINNVRIVSGRTQPAIAALTDGTPLVVSVPAAIPPQTAPAAQADRAWRVERAARPTTDSRVTNENNRRGADSTHFGQISVTLSVDDGALDISVDNSTFTRPSQ
jgi:hypothetical protein